MEDNNGSNFNAETSPEEEYGSCECCGETCLTVCESCGMPMNSPQEHGGGDAENSCCVHCCNTDGSLKSYEEVLEGMTGFMMKMRSMDKETAEKAASDYMAMMPAWSVR